MTNVNVCGLDGVRHGFTLATTACTLIPDAEADRMDGGVGPAPVTGVPTQLRQPSIDPPKRDAGHHGPSVSGLLANDDNRNRAVAHHRGGLASEQQSTHSAPPVRGHHDHIAALLLGGLHDGVGRRFVDTGDRRHLDA